MFDLLITFVGSVSVLAFAGWAIVEDYKYHRRRRGGLEE